MLKNMRTTLSRRSALKTLGTIGAAAVLGRYESPGLDGPNVKALVRRFGLQAGSMGL